MNDRADRGIGEAEGATGAWSVLSGARESEVVESVPPEGAGSALSAQLLGDLLFLTAVGGAQHDLGAKGESGRSGPTASPALEPRMFVRGQAGGVTRPQDDSTSRIGAQSIRGPCTPLKEGPPTDERSTSPPS